MRIYKYNYISIISYFNKLRDKINNYSFSNKNICFNKYIDFKIINYVDLARDFGESASFIK